MGSGILALLYGEFGPDVERQQFMTHTHFVVEETETRKVGVQDDY